MFGCLFRFVTFGARRLHLDKDGATLVDKDKIGSTGTIAGFVEANLPLHVFFAARERAARNAGPEDIG